MEEDLLLDLDESKQEEINRTDNRIQKLSEKVKLTSQERDQLRLANEEKEKALAEATKERDFFKTFSQVSSKYQNATEYQEKIWEKVKQGYDAEDATVAILAKEGKLGAQSTPQPEVKINAIGGSAGTGIGDIAEKTTKEMSRDEMRGQLQEAISKGELF